MISRDGIEALHKILPNVTNIDITLRKIAQTMPQPAWTALPDGRGDFVNDRGLAYTGQTQETARDWGWKAPFLEEDLVRLMDKVIVAVQTGDEFDLECRIYHHPTSQYRWNLVHGVALRDDTGAVEKWFGTWTDIHDRKLAQEEARTKAKQLELLTKNMPAIMWLADTSGNPDFISSYWLKYTGVDWEDAKGRLSDFVHIDDLEKCKSIWTKALAAKSKIETELRIKRASTGKYAWNIARVEPLLGKANELIGWIGTIQDVSEQKEAEKLLQLVIDSIPGKIWWKDKDSRYLGCNINTALMAGYNSPTDLIGKSDFDLPWKEQSHLFRMADQRVIESNVADYHMVEPILQSDGKMAWLDTSKIPLHDAEGNVVGTVGNSVDITTIVKLTEQREDFMASLAHDLKVPIVGAIRAFDVLTAGMVGPLTPDQINFVSKLHQSHEHLLRLIQNLLQVLRYEASPDELQISQCDLSGVFNSCVSDLQSMAKERQIEVIGEFPKEISVMADHLAMKRLLMNLVGNAIKFTPKGGQIKVTVSEQGHDVHISVSDTGAGISKEDQKQLFQRFWQGGSVKKYAAETGLGLYLCRQIAEGHGGTITVQSVEGEGATFSIVFPRRGPTSKVKLRLES